MNASQPFVPDRAEWWEVYDTVSGNVIADFPTLLGARLWLGEMELGEDPGIVILHCTESGARVVVEA